MLVADWIFVIVALLGTSFGCLTDLKGRWVPDWINYSLIFIGLGGHAIVSVLSASIAPILFSLAGAGFFYLIALVMFYAGAWGGGDAKLFIGLGALLPIYPAVLSAGFTAPWPFLLTVWVNVLLFGAVFGIIATAWLAIRYSQKVSKEFAEEVGKNKITLYIASATLVAPVIMLALNWSTLIALFWVLAVVLLYILFITKAVEKVCMYKIVTPSKLVEGDWIVDDVKIWGKTIYKPKRTGIEQKDIDKLIKLEKSGKLKRVKIKEGLPYVPAILVGLLVSLFFGDLLFIMMGGLL